MKLDSDPKGAHFHPEARAAQVYLEGAARTNVIYADEEGRHAILHKLDDNGRPQVHKTGPKKGEYVTEDFYGHVRIELPAHIREGIEKGYASGGIMIDPAKPGAEATAVGYVNQDSSNLEARVIAANPNFAAPYGADTGRLEEYVRATISEGFANALLTPSKGLNLRVTEDGTDVVSYCQSCYRPMAQCACDRITSHTRTAERFRLGVALDSDDGTHFLVNEELKVKGGISPERMAELQSRLQDSCKKVIETFLFPEPPTYAQIETSQTIRVEMRRIILDVPDGRAAIETVFRKYVHVYERASFVNVPRHKYSAVLAELRAIE